MITTYGCHNCNYSQSIKVPSSSWVCSNCGHINDPPSRPQVGPEIQGRLDATLALLSGMAQAQALPVISLLEGWWNIAPTDIKSKFVEALGWRLVEMVERGKFDERLAQAVDLPAFRSDHPEMFVEALAKRLAEESFAKKNGDYTSKGLSDWGLTDATKEAFKQAVREAAKRAAHDHREVIESAVRDRMPSIEELTRKIVEEVTNETAREVRERMHKRGDG